MGTISAPGLVGLLIGIFCASCAHRHAPPPPVVIEERHGPSRVMLDQAEAMVRDYVFHETPGMNPAARFPLREITREPLWRRMRAQLFLVADGPRFGEAYLFHDRMVMRLGNAVGGPGLTSWCIADFPNEPGPQLIFTYGWGSGRTQSHVGMWIGGPTWIPAAAGIFDFDLSLHKLDDRRIRVDYGRFDPGPRHFRRFGEWGALAPPPPGYPPGLIVRLNARVPADVREKTWK